MSLKIPIFTPEDNSTINLVADFVISPATLSNDPTADWAPRAFIKITTSARDTDGLTYDPRVVGDLITPVLNGQKQRYTDTSDPYPTINDMFNDYIYDYMEGHAADLYSSGVAYKAPLQS